MEGAIDTEHGIQELDWAERSKHNLRGVLSLMGNEQSHGAAGSLLSVIILSLLRSHFGNALAFSPLHPLQVMLSLQHRLSWLLVTPGSHFMDQVAAVLGLHVHRSLPRMFHNLLKASSLGMYLISHCLSSDGSSQPQILFLAPCSARGQREMSHI